METLKPCPFCGSQAEIIPIQFSRDGVETINYENGVLSCANEACIANENGNMCSADEQKITWNCRVREKEMFERGFEMAREVIREGQQAGGWQYDTAASAYADFKKEK